ncbi:protein PLANT CADMIUM RESISTANCE 2-like [Macadamia integrifolia]|uniref:protein PLANT CADMIUM RESISTANCE 2-like n=1 Tax=Macadamia integrifolia TaxID=60698 RepID=UPI001C4FB513|nr:protein PLANT CADMIUM RESISTANCE 2-like [Macadamia integrifolia]XP_042487428.1 protein PLANT CADMIUM RESISTANCE 2-like [Macadamia integrifolia]
MYPSEKNYNQIFNPDSSSTAPPLPQYNDAAPAIGIPVNSTNLQAPVPWSSGLCDCGDDLKSCCLTCWCRCVAFGEISEIVDEGSTSCVANGVIYTMIMIFSGGCQCCYSYCYRSKMREKYNLEEHACSDFLVHCCCEPCAICQEYRELQSRGFDVSLGWHGNMERSYRGLEMPPIVQQGMTR